MVAEYCKYLQIDSLHIIFKLYTLTIHNVLINKNHGRPQEFFQGGQTFGVGPQKICEGGPPYFLDKL